MRRLFKVARTAVLGAVCLGAGAAMAQPACPGGVKLVIPFAVGSINDVLARAVAQEMSTALREQVVPENRLGAGGMIATTAIAKAPADGCMMGLATSSQMVANVGMYKSLPFDIERDFAYVGLISRIQLVLVTNTTHADNLKGFLDELRKRPGTLTYGSGGVGGISHLVGEAFVHQARVEAKHVPYKGNAQALTDLAGKHIDFMFDPLVTSQPMARQGQLRMVAISGDKRSPRAPELPTFAEQGLEGYEAYTWNGLIVPAGVPAARMERLHAALTTALATAPVKNLIEQGGSEIIGPSTQQQAAEFARNERAKWLPLIHRLNIELN